MSVRLLSVAVLAAVLTSAVGAQAATVVVQSINPAGDNVTNPLPGDATVPIGASGWIYNNVRTGGTIGINTTYPQSGNGSVYFNGTGSGAKADVETYAVGSPFGALSALTSFGYDWYRDSSSAAAGHLHPAIRLYVVSSDGTQSGYLVFEEIYNQLSGGGNVTTNAWVTESITGSTNLWASGNTLPNNVNVGNSDTYSTTLAEWQASSKNYQVWGISSGIGSGWGAFTGAVDNITLGFNGVSTTYNFETAAGPAGATVPVPAAAWTGMALLGGLGGLRLARRRTA